MNAMTNALQSAGVKIPPVRYRIWHWLRDHPDKTHDEICAGLGHKSYSIYDYLNEMEKSSVVKVFSDVTRPKGSLNLPYKIKRYSVTDKVNYEAPVRKAHVSKVNKANDFKAFNDKVAANTSIALPAMAGRPAGRPRLEGNESNDRYSVVLTKEIVAVIDQIAAEFLEQNDVALSRTQVVGLLVRRHVRGAK